MEVKQKADLKIAVLVDKEVPTDHSFIQGVLEKSLLKIDCEITFIGYKSTLAIQQNENLRFLTVNSGSENFFFKKIDKLRHFTNLIKTSGPYDVLYSRNDPVFLIIGWYLKRIKVARIHFHQISHLHAFSKADRSLLYRVKAFGDLLLRKIFLQYADRILVISEQMKRFLEKEWPRFSDKYLVYPLGVEVSDFNNVIPYHQRKYDVVYIGTLTTSRRLDVMIDAIKIYRQKYGPLTLHVWGQSHNPKEDAALKAYTSEIGMESSVIFYGKVARRDVLENLKNTKIGLSAIPSDGIFNQISPTKLMEYLAAGCCVIATSGIGDQEEIIGEAFGKHELIPFSAEAIAEAIHKVISDPERAVAFSETGRNYIFEKRSYSEMAQRLKSQMLQLISTR